MLYEITLQNGQTFLKDCPNMTAALSVAEKLAEENESELVAVETAASD